MAQSTQEKIQNGKTELQQGNREQAHRIFLKILEQEPNNQMALLYAGASSSGREEAEFYLQQAAEKEPDNESIKKGLQWAQNLPSKPFKKPKTKKVRETKQGARKERLSAGPLDRSALLLMLGLLLFGVVSALLAFGYMTFFKGRLLLPASLSLNNEQPPANQEPAETVASTATLQPTATIKPPEALPPTWTPVPSLTPSPRPTEEIPPASDLLPEIISDGQFQTNLEPLPVEEKKYPPVNDLLGFIENPELYRDEYLSITLPILHVSAAIIDDSNEYILLLDTSKFIEGGGISTPIVVFGFVNNGESVFEVGQEIEVFGGGIGAVNLDAYFAMEDNILPESMYEDNQSRVLPAVAGMLYSLP